MSKNIYSKIFFAWFVFHALSFKNQHILAKQFKQFRNFLNLRLVNVQNVHFTHVIQYFDNIFLTTTLHFNRICNNEEKNKIGQKNKMQS